MVPSSIKITRFAWRLGLSICSIVPVSGAALADSFSIDTPLTAQNGGFLIDGSDTLTITNNGSIVVTGTDAIDMSGNRNILTNNGTISTFGNGAFGINGLYFETVTNNGSLTTNGDNAEGIDVESSNSVFNFGTITTSGRSAEGIDTNNDNLIKNFGTITTMGKDSNAIESDDFSQMFNFGVIFTTGENSHGLFGDDNNTAISSGTITTSGLNSNGIDFWDLNHIENSGTIVTYGPGGDGIRARFLNVITNSGKVVSANANAFNFLADNTLNLHAPAFVGGAFSLGTNAKVNIKTGPSHSILWTFDPTSLNGGAPNFSGPVPVFQGTSGANIVVTTFDPTALSTSADALADLTGLLSGITQNRLAEDDPVALSYAQNSPTIIDKTFAEIETVNKGWARVAGSLSNYNGGGTTLSSDLAQIVLAAGYDWSISADTILRFAAGYTRGSITSDSKFATSSVNDTQGLFLAAAGRSNFENAFLKFGLTAGTNRHENDRLVNDNLAPLGIAHAKASYDSFWINPEVSYGMSYALNDEWTATPSVRLSYAGEWVDGYTELGTNANATVGKRQIGVAELGLEWAVTHQTTIGKMTGRIGYAYRKSLGDSNTDITLLGITKSVANSNKDRHIAYLGGEALFALTQTIDLEIGAQVEFGKDHVGGTGSIKLVSEF